MSESEKHLVSAIISRKRENKEKQAVFSSLFSDILGYSTSRSDESDQNGTKTGLKQGGTSRTVKNCQEPSRTAGKTETDRKDGKSLKSRLNQVKTVVNSKIILRYSRIFLTFRDIPD